MSLKIDVHEDHGGTAATVALSGRLDGDGAAQLDVVFEPILTRKPRAIVLDLAGLDYISSDGIGVILGARKRLEAGGGKMLLTSLRPHIEKVFRVIQAIPDGGLFRNRAELDAYLASIQRRAKERPE